VTRLPMVAHALEMSQCEMPVRKPTRPDTAMTAQRTPFACSRMACISSTLADIRPSSVSSQSSMARLNSLNVNSDGWDQIASAKPRSVRPIRPHDRQACSRTGNGAPHRVTLLQGNIRCRDELQSGGLFAPKGISKAIARKKILRKRPDEEEVTTVPCCRINQLAWVFDRVFPHPANRARPYEAHTGGWRRKPTPSCYDKLIQIVDRR
jgi:hypothetical protein